MIDRVSIEGDIPALAAEADRALADIKGRRVSVARLYAVAAAIEQLCSRAGYVLTRVTVPPQKLVDHGTLKLLVVDGFIETIDVARVPERARAVVASRLAALVRRPHVTLDMIERALLIAGQVPGLRLSSTVAAGESDGGTTLIVEGEHHLVSGSVGGDDLLGQSLGTWQLRGSVAVNDALGIGEQVYGALGSGYDLDAALAGASPLQTYGGGALIPLGADGLGVNPEYTHSVSRTVSGPGVAASIGAFDRYAVSLTEPLILNRHEALNVKLALETITQSAQAPDFGLTLNRDHFTVLRGGSDYSGGLPWGEQIEASATLSRGLGGRTASDGIASGIPLSRIGAGSDFAKLDASIRLVQPLPDDWHLDVTGIAQSSFGKPILRPEQFQLAGINAVSSFAGGTFSVDQGATLRGEVVRPLAARFEGADATVSPYAFAAGGRGQVLDPTAVEQEYIDAVTLGLGIRGSVAARASSLGSTFGVEMGRRYSDVPGMRRGWRYGVSTASTF